MSSQILEPSLPAPARTPRRVLAALRSIGLLEWLSLALGPWLVIRYAWLMDDAFVYFRYVDNLLFLGATGRGREIAITGVVSLVTMLVSAVALIPALGGLGAAAATSIALVVSLWSTLAEIAYFPFFILSALTVGLFAAGMYTLHHWKLEATSRGLLLIATLLTPLDAARVEAITQADVRAARDRLQLVAVPFTQVIMRDVFGAAIIGAEEFTRFLLDDLEQAIHELGPETVALVHVEPVQNAGGCFTPAPDYLPRLREICDRHGVLLACDEVITGFGRLGYWTGSERYDVVPDLLTFAKGVTSAYAPLGGLAFTDRVAEALQRETTTMFTHGATWGGHPVSCAVALANLEVFEKEGVLDNVRDNQDWFGQQLWDLHGTHEIVGDVRGTGYFFAMELVKDREHKVGFSDEESERLLRGFLSRRLLELGLICRADDRDEPVIQLSPPLIADREVLGEIVGILDQVLEEAEKRVGA